MKTAISIPDEIFQAADHLARSLGMSRSQLYSTAIADYVEDHHVSDTTAALDRVYSGCPSSLDKVVQDLQAGSIPESDW
jgi:predicted transcriptional regulator